VSRSVCAACRRPVVWVTFVDGVKRPIERCAAQAGNIALQPSLLGGEPTAQASSLRTSYRLHSDYCGAHQERVTLRCKRCREPMRALVDGREMCGRCQQTERSALAAATFALVDHIGTKAARARIERALELPEKRARRFR